MASSSVSGTTQVIAAMQAVLASVHAQANTAIADAVQTTFDGSQIDCPVDKGELIASGTSETHDLGGSVTYGTDHCWYVELGTYKMAAQPYLYPNFIAGCTQLIDDCRSITP